MEEYTCVCDKCGKEFVPRLSDKVKMIKGKPIQQIYFTCPSCGEKYIVCYQDRKIVSYQEKLETLQYKKSMLGVSAKESDSLYNQIQLVNRKISKRMDYLSNKYKKYFESEEKE